jgi:hypothetical protein
MNWLLVPFKKHENFIFLLEEDAKLQKCKTALALPVLDAKIWVLKSLLFILDTVYLYRLESGWNGQ